MDNGLIIGIVVLAVSALLLILISAAEAGVAAVSRHRVHLRTSNGVMSLLDSYIRQRQHILRALSVGATSATVVATVALTLMLVGEGKRSAWEIVVTALIALVAISFVRQSARVTALLNPEATGLYLARLIAVLQIAFTPLAWAVGAPARSVLRILGTGPETAEANPATELLSILETPEDPESGQSLSEERRMMRGILAMSAQTVREIMSPRIDLTAVSTDASLTDVMKIINSSGFSRIPLYGESIDHVIGVLYAKDLLAYLQTGAPIPALRDCARAPYFVPETKRADQLLSDLRRDQVHMAIVVDEYGGTAGVVTVEDLLEEIVGEIADEYDTEDVDVQRLSDHEAIVDARLPVDDLNELFGTDLANEDFDTVGGLIFSLLGRLATPGDAVETEDEALRLEVLSVHGRRIKKVRVRQAERSEEAATAV